MKIGLSSIGFGTLAAPALIRTLVTNAERLNFSTVWAPEHVVLLDRYTSKYPYSTDGTGQFLAPTEIPIGDPFPTLTYAAACTTRIRLATGICLVPEHNPLVLAKTVATVDRLSGGRFIFGVGCRVAGGGVRSSGRPVRASWSAHARVYRSHAQALDRAEQLASGQVRQFHECVELPEAGQRQRRPGVVRRREQSGIATCSRVRRRLDWVQPVARPGSREDQKD